MSDKINKRTEYRIPYFFEHEAPLFQIELRPYKILDLSENGARIKFENSFPLTVNQFFFGFITFKSKERYKVKGFVKRINDREVALVFNDGLPYKIILQEQLRLRALKQ